MNGSQQNKPPSHELRILIASLLSMAVVLLWIKFFAPKPPLVPPQANRPGQMAPVNPGQQGALATNPSATGAPAAAYASTAAAVPAIAGAQEQTIVIENNLYRVEMSNRGAVVKSWQLKNYLDDAKPPLILDLVHPQASEETGGWPFSLVLDDEQQEKLANSALYRVSSSSDHLNAPAEAQFEWSDGRLEITKHFHFDHSYVVRVETSAKLNGAPITAGLAWRGGFGDLTVTNPIPVETVSTYFSEAGRLTALPHKKLDGLDAWAHGVWRGGKDFTGIEDRYFTAAFLPANGAAAGTLETRYWKESHTIQVDGKPQQEPVPEIATATAISAQPQSLRVYVGPKDYDDLKKMNPPLHGLINFGWLEVVAEPLFHALKWIHKYVPNWGWSIVVLTLLINMLFFPLRISGYKMTQKMQRVAPEIKQIQDKYKKYKFNDPKKQEMNKEVMAIYQREGINPVGGCVPQLLQMPIWFGLYRALQGTIELRHASWFGWIKDLSAKDPYYILPILMGLSIYYSSKMTPMTATDAQQQAMMKMMPLMMSGMFLVIPYPSGLAVYILTSGIVGVFQQWYLNRRHPMQPAAKPVRGKKG